MKHINKAEKHSERGSAGVKLLIAGVIFGLIGYAFVNFIPVAYQGQSFKQDMETAIIQGLAMPTNKGKPTDIVKRNLESAIRKNDLPPDTYLEVKKQGQGVTARVYYKQKISILPFGIYEYEYVFDNSSTPNGFLIQ